MYNLLAVFFGGGIGASLRFLFSLYSYKKFGLTYWATFLINIIGCFFLGIVASFAINNANFSNTHIYLFLTTGIAGGFTTFSTFSYENYELIKEGKIINSFIYSVSSILVGLAAVYCGFAVLNLILK